MTFTATVATLSLSPGTPTGSVTFYDEAMVLGSSILDDDGRAAFTSHGLAVGSHLITAVYSGDATYTPSSSTGLAQLTTLRQLFVSLLQR
ncbi:MAG TPA: Ig-like domain-containing protein [Roseiflexaceae bacterium]|nr:Ig-like domain-containing protein [Roseiflexaceae bacterium]